MEAYLFEEKVEARRKKPATGRVLDDMSFLCGAQLQELDDIPATLKDIVFVREMLCGQPIEKLYYAARFDDICVYCAEVVSPWSDTEQYYPQCSAMTDCSEKPPIENEKFKKSDYVSCCFFGVFCIHAFFTDIHSNT